MSRPATHTGMSLRRLLPFAVIAVVAVAGSLLLADFLTFEALAANRDILVAWRDANYALFVLGFMAVYVAIVAFSLPGATLATLTGGFLFGVFPGALFNILAATLGAAAIFSAARYGFGAAMARKLDASEGRIAAFRDGLRNNEVSFLLIMRLVPVLPFFVANLLPAMVGVRLWRFVWTTFVGIVPGGIVYTWVGAGLGEVFARGETPNLGIIFEWHILGPILGLAALALLPVLLKRGLGRRALQ